MTDRQLLQQALDALKIADELCDGHGVDFKEYGLKVDKDIQRKYKKAITALRERLAQPEEKYQYGTPLLDLFTREQTHE
jgi:hypothetical protein